jgi:hypothetical protein
MGKIVITFYGFLLEHPSRWFVIRGDNTGKVERVGFGTREQVILDAWKKNKALLLRDQFSSTDASYILHNALSAIGKLSAVKRKRNRTLTSEQARETIKKRWLKANPKYSLPPPRSKPD